MALHDFKLLSLVLFYETAVHSVCMYAIMSQKFISANIIAVAHSSTICEIFSLLPSRISAARRLRFFLSLAFLFFLIWLFAHFLYSAINDFI